MSNLPDIGTLAELVRTQTPDWVVNTRHDLVDIDARLARLDNEQCLQARRAARVTEWHMAQRWPPNPVGVSRTDDRPELNALNSATDRALWNNVYTVGRCPLDWLLSPEREMAELTQASVIQHVVALERRPSPTSTPRMPAAGDWRTIVIDPPWPVEKVVKDSRPYQGVELDYPTMTLDDIASLPIKKLADPDGSHLYLWTTHKLLPDALDIVAGWDYRYQCLLTWVKTVGVSPFSWMYDTEHCIFARGGKGLDLLQMGLRLSVHAGQQPHSQKPDEFYDRVIAASPVPRLEMFARRNRDGFTGWGDEVA
jgi:N6-adenosine-specific RNA methylase IME4